MMDSKKKDAENTRLPERLFRGFVGDGKLPSYIGITINQWKVVSVVNSHF